MFPNEQNKKELYLYLAEYCTDANKQELLNKHCYEECGFFEVLTAGLKVMIEQMKYRPELALFEMRGYFENDPELKSEVRALIESYSQFEIQKNMMSLDSSEFIEAALGGRSGLDKLHDKLFYDYND